MPSVQPRWATPSIRSPLAEPLTPPVPQPLPGEEGIPHPYPTWKAYRNDEYKFELRYPSDWRLTSGGGSEIIQLWRGGAAKIAVLHLENPQHLRAEEFLERLLESGHAPVRSWREPIIISAQSTFRYHRLLADVEVVSLALPSPQGGIFVLHGYVPLGQRDAIASQVAQIETTFRLR
jgi:hypothetical protein